VFAPALARIGLHPDWVMVCETWNDRNVLPAVEAGLSCKGLAGVVGEVTQLSLTASRRLQLSTGETRATALIIRRWRNAKEHSLAGEPTGAATRWQVSPSPSRQTGFDGLPRQRWKVELMRAWGGEPHSSILEVCHA
jgi:protein ImuA